MVDKLSVQEFGDWLRSQNMSENVVEIFRGGNISKITKLASAYLKELLP